VCPSYHHSGPGQIWLGSGWVLMQPPTPTKASAMIRAVKNLRINLTFSI